MKIFAIPKGSVLIAALAVGFWVATPSYAHIVQYGATFSGAAEDTPNNSAGTGTALVTFDLDFSTMRVEANFSGLTGNTSASHIHCCTLNPGTGLAGVATVTPSFTDFPLGVTAGTYDHTFDMSLPSNFSAGFLSANGGNATSALTALLAGLDAGKAYFNIHTSFAGGGEIRGFLQPVPEPETYALLLAGLGLMALTAARRRRG